MKLKKHGLPAFTQVIGPIASGFLQKLFADYMNEGIIRDYCRLVCNLEFSQIEEQIMRVVPL